MKKLFLIFITITMSSFIYAQEEQSTTKHNELGLIFNDFDNFGFTYKTGTATSLWRFQSVYLNGDLISIEQIQDSINTTDNDINLMLRVGKEFRKPVTEKLELRYGLDVTFGYNNTSVKYNDISQDDYDYEYKTSVYDPGLGLVFGFNYILNDNFLLGFELLPNVGYSIKKYKREYSRAYTLSEYQIEKTTKDFDFSLSSSSVYLSVVYKFEKK